MRYRGVFTALIAPMKDGELDPDSLELLLEDQMAKGVDGLVINGTTGEAATLSEDEQIRMIEWVTEKVDGTLPIIAGVSTNDTRTAIKKAERLDDLGVDGLLVVTPYYNKPNQAGLVEHFRAVAGSVGTDIVLYNVPSRTAVSLAPKSIETLAVLPNVKAIKEATTDMVRASEVIAAAGDQMAVFAGDDIAFLPMLSLGAAGIVSAASNAITRPFVDIFKHFNWGDLDEAREVHYRYLAPIQALYAVVNPLGVKTAAQLKGLIDTDEVRLPLAAMSDAERETLKNALTEGGVIG